MLSEDTLKLIQMRRNPVNSLQDLDKKLIGTREGFIFYTTNFRKDFDTKMHMLGRLEQENKDLHQELTKYKERNEKAIQYLNIVAMKTDKPNFFTKLKDTIWGEELLEILEDKEKA